MAEPATETSIDTALAHARTTLLTDPSRGMALVAQAENAAIKLPRSRMRNLALAKVAWLRGEVHLRTGEPDKSHDELARAFELIADVHEPVELRGDLLKAEGTLQAQRGFPAQALANYQQAFALYQKLGLARSQSVVLQLIAVLYGSANDYRSAEKYYAQAAQLFNGDPTLSLMLHNNRGNVLLQLGRHVDAEREYQQAIALAQRTGSRALQATIVGNLARNQMEMGRLGAADHSIAEGRRLVAAEPLDDVRPHLETTAAEVALKRGDLAEAQRLVGRAFQGLDLATTNAGFRDDHLIAYQIYRAAGDNPHALAHLEAAKRLTDEATKVATTTSAALMAARFDYANQELRIAKLQTEEANRRTENERARAHFQRAIFLVAGVATAIGFGLLGFFLVTLQRSRNEVRAANADLAASNVALEKALAAKTEFLATTSHEIRTPLNGILGMTQVMLSDPALAGPTRERIDIVHGAGLSMRALVDDILDLAKMETGNLTVDPQPMDLVATLREVTRMWADQAHSKGLAFALDLGDVPQRVVGDAARLRQIVFNLLSNALKFTASGGIGLAARVDPSGARLWIDITDTGIGIPADKREVIFESFRQVDASTTRQFGGTGLGLAISRNLAHALGGGISVSSREGEGSTFRLDLPLVRAEAIDDAADAPRIVLVLERNPIARSMIRTLLDVRGLRTEFVADAADARRRLDGGDVAVMVIDQASVGGEGEAALAAAEELASAAHDAGAAALLLWGDAGEADRTRLAGMCQGRLLRKPLAGAVLVEAVVVALSQIPGNRSQLPLVSQAA